ncbi:glycosyltransferase [Candidatus Bipolaricaulota bacterium]|nr:glycosyltransferase [Candidatus Bipolaricaulota bacterium]
MSERGIERYLPLIGEERVAEIVGAARPLLGLRVLHISSTFHGGGVAGMLRSLVPLMNDLGLDADWSLLYGTPKLFRITKGLHNALQGEEGEFREEDIRVYHEINEFFACFTPLFHDVVVVHDPQPLPMIRYAEKDCPWIWRCHIDLSSPAPGAWELVKPLLLRYDAGVISSERFRKSDLPLPTHIVPPAIDPFSPINRELTEEETAAKLAQYEIPQDKPLLLQVSRFDKWKDPLGVLQVFHLVKQEVDCRLVMLGNMAADDPEGPEIFGQVQAQAGELPDVHLVTVTDEYLVNALQRAATVVLQLSTREGFGLTVSEALWKGTPVVATEVGGIPLQVVDGETGFLTRPRDYEAMTERVVELLEDRELAARLGKAGREHVRRNFLIPRLLLDWLRVLAEMV